LYWPRLGIATNDLIGEDHAGACVVLQVKLHPVEA
jgi:hypothetical protein